MYFLKIVPKICMYKKCLCKNTYFAMYNLLAKYIFSKMDISKHLTRKLQQKHKIVKKKEKKFPLLCSFSGGS